MTVEVAKGVVHGEEGHDSPLEGVVVGEVADELSVVSADLL